MYIFTQMYGLMDTLKAVTSTDEFELQYKNVQNGYKPQEVRGNLHALGIRGYIHAPLAEIKFL